MNETELQELAPSDSVPLAPEFTDKVMQKGWFARSIDAVHNALTILIIVVLMAFSVAFLAVILVTAAIGRPGLRTECFRYTNVSESLQPASGCEHALAGNCSTAPGVCVAFAFLSDTNASTVISGSMYRCGDPKCTNVGDACRCANPALGRVTAFCRRHVAGKEYGGANFACN
jgi:hypothetical protein